MGWREVEDDGWSDWRADGAAAAADPSSTGSSALFAFDFAPAAPDEPGLDTLTFLSLLLRSCGPLSASVYGCTGVRLRFGNGLSSLPETDFTMDRLGIPGLTMVFANAA